MPKLCTEGGEGDGLSITGHYLGMELRIDAFDQENLACFRRCAAGEFHLQRCTACKLLR